LYSPRPKPTNTTIGNVTVNTTKPVIVESDLKTPALEKEVETKANFWASKTKKQKTIIIISVVASVSLLAYIALKKK
jgi:hypothetical protein